MLDEVEKVCSHVAIIKKGVLLVRGEVEQILGDEYMIELKADNMDELHNAIREYDIIADVTKVSDKYVVKLSNKISNGEINRYFFSKGIELTHLASKKKNLEIEFLDITN